MVSKTVGDILTRLLNLPHRSPAAEWHVLRGMISGDVTDAIMSCVESDWIVQAKWRRAFEELRKFRTDEHSDWREAERKLVESLGLEPLSEAEEAALPAAIAELRRLAGRSLAASLAGRIAEAALRPDCELAAFMEELVAVGKECRARTNHEAELAAKAKEAFDGPEIEQRQTDAGEPASAPGGEPGGQGDVALPGGPA